MSVVTYTYKRQQQRTGMTDQNCTIHAYVYDQLGRQTADRVTTLGTLADMRACWQRLREAVK